MGDQKITLNAKLRMSFYTVLCLDGFVGQATNKW